MQVKDKGNIHAQKVVFAATPFACDGSFANFSLGPFHNQFHGSTRGIWMEFHITVSNRHIRLSVSDIFFDVADSLCIYEVFWYRKRDLEHKIYEYN